MVQPGTIVEFLQKNDVLVGVCQYSNAQHVRVLTEHNRELNVNERKILHILKHSLPQSMSRMERVAALKAWAEKVSQTAITIDLQTLWEVLQEESEGLDLKSLAEMYFTDPGDLECSLLLRALVADRTFFERKGDERFIARSAECVAQIQAQQKRQAEKAQERQVLCQWISACEKTPEQPPAGVQSSLALLQDVAVLGRRSPHFSTVSQLYAEAGVGHGPLEERCLKTLIRSGVWDEDINLYLLEHQVPQAFSRELLQSVEAIPATGVEHSSAPRLDLRHLQTITIDDIETTDIDDALSWEERPEGSRLWVHIADASAFVIPDSPLDQEAARRFTSIYLCESKIEMLPPRLSQNLCSLIAGEPRLALSVALDLSPSYEVLSARLYESIIEVKQRMSYDEVDQRLAELPLLQPFLKVAQYHRAQRLARGAVEFQRPELRIKVTEDKQILLKRVERDSPAQLLVSELMILANYWVARLLSAAHIPLIYKVQEAPGEEKNQGKPLLKRAEMSVRPGSHYGLGLDVYTQFTSPIRRYNDLILHRQIKHWLHTGKSLYSEEQIQHLIALSEQAVFSANFIQRENHRYWLYKYLQNLPTPRIFPAQVQSMSGEKVVVYLPDFCLELPMSGADVGDVKEGHHLWLEIVHVDPRKGVLQVCQARDPA